MTRRERLERKLERRAEWAASRDRQSAIGFQKARTIADGIPLGQPILVGHHSEKRHRADIARIDSGMRAGVESQQMAAHHRSKAAGLEDQLGRSVFSDDTDAIEALEARIAEREAQRDHMKARNAAYRKGVEAFAAFEGCTIEQATARIRTIEEGLSWCRQPHPSYSLTNLGATIRTDKKRIEEIRRRQAQQAAADAAPGGVLITTTPSGYNFGPAAWARVTFAEKPDRAILTALKEAGYSWGGGAWTGDAAKLPACVEALRE